MMSIDRADRIAKLAEALGKISDAERAVIADSFRAGQLEVCGSAWENAGGR